MSSAEVAERIGVSRQTVARWIREDRLPARRIKVGGRMIYRIRRSDFVEFVRRYVQDDW